MTYADAIQQLTDAIAAKDKVSLVNVADNVLGISATNKQQLQDMLNKLLGQNGVLTDDDQAALNNLLATQAAARKTKAKIIARDIAIGLLALGGMVGIYFTFRHGKKLKK